MRAYFKRCCLFFVALLLGASQLYAQTFTSITPNNGLPGTQVMITGTGLSDITFIKFGLVQVPATNVSATSVTATLPNPAVQFETPGVVPIFAIDSSSVSHATGLQFAIKGNWTVVVTNAGSAAGLENAATFQVVEGQAPPMSATPVKDLATPTFEACQGVAIHPNGRTAYVANENGSTVSAIDIATNSVKGVVIVDIGPIGIAINTSGTIAYVTNRIAGTISVLNISGTMEQAPALLRNIASDMAFFPNPEGIAVSFDDSMLYVVNVGSNHLNSFSLSTPDVPSLTSSVDTPSSSLFNVAVTPDNTKIYVADQLSKNIYVYDLPLNGQKVPDATITAPSGGPFGMAINREGTKLYVACKSFASATSQIGVIDIATNTLIQTISITSAITELLDIIISPDDQFLYATDIFPNLGLVRTIDITDPANPTFPGDIQSGGSTPFFLAITPDPAPLAAFTASPTGIQTFQFDGTDSVSPVGNIASYEWNFGDGTMESGVKVTHAYANPGTYSVTLTVTNTAGTSTDIIFPTGQTVLNNGGPSAITSQSITVCPPTPTISGIIPTSGPAGTSVTLMGTNLSNIQEVFFGGVLGGIVNQNGTSLVAVAPAGIAAGTSVAVSVLACDGTIVVGPNFLYTSPCCPPTPTIASISPSRGRAGSRVTITGTNLTNIQEVFFDGVPGGIVSQNGMSLVVIAPAGICAGTSVTVSLLDCNGTTVTGPRFLYNCCNRSRSCNW